VDEGEFGLAGLVSTSEFAPKLIVWIIWELSWVVWHCTPLEIGGAVRGH
jgi:hypothetical protein